MKQSQKFWVIGKKPAFGERGNAMLRAMDLGVSGAYVSFCHEVVVKFSDDISENQISRHPSALKEAYKQMGCLNVKVVKVEG